MVVLFLLLALLDCLFPDRFPHLLADDVHSLAIFTAAAASFCLTGCRSSCAWRIWSPNERLNERASAACLFKTALR